jgi:hypothetical protein
MGSSGSMRAQIGTLIIATRAAIRLCCASNFYRRGGMLLHGLTNAQCCFDALD